MTISSALSPSSRARGLGILVNYKNLNPVGSNLPQKVAVLGQGSTAVTYDAAKEQVFSAQEAGETYGFGSPIHLAVSQLLPANNDGVGGIPVTVYPLTDPAGGVAAVGRFEGTGTQTTTTNYKLRINNMDSEEFTITVGDTMADVVAAIVLAINANVNLPVIASADGSAVVLTAKWEGLTGNDIFVECIGEEAGITFTVTQPTGGAGTPDVDDALDLLGDDWETIIVNCFGYDNTGVLGKIKTVGDGRWDATVRRPFVSVVGNTVVDVTTACSIAHARTTDKINCQVVEPGANDLPWQVAARTVARVAKQADTDPASGYCALELTGLTPGDPEDQWTFAQRDYAVQHGSSTIEVRNGVSVISDIVTMYHPSGDPNPAYRYVSNIMKLMNIIYDLDNEFSSTAWAGKPLIPDGQATTNPNAKTPGMMRGTIFGYVDGWAQRALISDPTTAKTAVRVGINESNPNRLDASLTLQLSGNTNQIAVDVDFGFYFGSGV